MNDLEYRKKTSTSNVECHGVIKTSFNIAIACIYFYFSISSATSSISVGVAHPRKYLLNGISHVVSQFIVTNLEKNQYFPWALKG